MNIKDIHINPDNPRYIKDERYQKLKKSLKEFPKMMKLRPIIIDNKGMILGGNMRYLAMIDLGYKEIPEGWVIKASELTEEERRKFQIVDNIPFGDWDYDILANEWDLKELQEWGIELPGIEDIIEPNEKDDEVPELPKEPKSKLGDLYQLDNHRLLCGDATKKEDVERLMDGKKADMVFTDPPYFMGFEGSIHSDGKKSYNARYDSIRNDSRVDLEFINEYISFIKKYNKGAFYVFFGRLGIDIILDAINDAGLKWRNIIIWDKGNHTLSNSDYMSKYEPLVYGWVEEHKFYNKPEFDIWELRRTLKNDLHPTMKPVELSDRAIINSSERNNIILDFFGGSGSTLIACEKLNRICYMMEIDPIYIDVIIERWENYTGKKAVSKSKS